MKLSATSAAVLLASLDAAAAQSGAWGQCGGQGWNGATTCVSGYTCTYSNPYYSQCLPGGNGGGNTLTTSTRTTTKTTTTTTVKPSTGQPTSSAIPTTTSKAGSSSTSVSSAAPTTTGGSSSAAGNPFAGKQIYANPYYASEINSLAIPSLTGTLKAKATEVANVGTFVWLDTVSKVPTVDTYLTNIDALNAAGASPPVIGAFVVYDLPDRDCAAAASNGEFSSANNGLANYENYIDQIAANIKKHPNTNVVLIIEPDSLANMVTNLNVAKCATAQPTYEAGVEYALKTLNLPNVAMYIDAGHSGWLGWPANQAGAVTEFNKVFTGAGKPAAVRGLVTNVSNYNAWTIATCPSYTGGNPVCDEEEYVTALAPQLTAVGFPAHFITDSSRNGVQPTAQLAEGDWCNVIGAGFGVRPTANTGNTLLDAFVWVKPGGEADGTSNTTAARYDFHCGYADALQPAPEAGTWFQAYFAQLLQNANPSF